MRQTKSCCVDKFFALVSVKTNHTLISFLSGNIVMGTPVRRLYRSRPSYTYHSQQSGTF